MCYCGLLVVGFKRTYPATLRDMVFNGGPLSVRVLLSVYCISPRTPTHLPPSHEDEWNIST